MVLQFWISLNWDVRFTLLPLYLREKRSLYALHRRDWVGCRAGLDVAEKTRIFSLPETNLESSVLQLVPQSLHRLSYPGTPFLSLSNKRNITQGNLNLTINYLCRYASLVASKWSENQRKIMCNGGKVRMGKEIRTKWKNGRSVYIFWRSGFYWIWRGADW